MALRSCAPIEALLKDADQPLTTLDENSLSSALQAAIPDRVSLAEDEWRGAFADIVAFLFRPSFGSERRPWGIYWSDMMSGVSADGVEFHSPNVGDIDGEIIAHWITRSIELSHPVLRARYADLAWEIGKFLKQPPTNLSDKALPASFKVSIESARVAIDGYLGIIEQGLNNDEHHAWQYLDRALGLAATINDKDRIAKGKTTLFAYCRARVKLGDRFMWWRFDDILWNHTKPLALNEAEFGEIIGVLESALEISADLSNPKDFDPYNATMAADRLAKRRAQTRAPLAETNRAMLVAATATEAAAKLASGMTAIALLEGLIPRYRNVGMLDDAARIETLIRGRAEEALGEMKRVSVPINVTQEELNQWAETITKGSLEDGLIRVADNFVIGEDEIQRQLKSLANEAPLYAMSPSLIMDSDGLTIAKIGSIEDDLDGRSIQHAANRIGWEAPWLSLALNRLKKKHEFGVEDIVAFVRDCGFFKSEREPLLVDGIKAWLADDSIKAVHVLVPQIEAALRDLLTALGASVAEPDPRTGGFMKIGLGKIISHSAFVAAVPKDIRFHLRALYNDARGINLRNNLAHGLSSPSLIGAGAANWVIHSLILIGSLRVQKTIPEKN